MSAVSQTIPLLTFPMRLKLKIRKGKLRRFFNSLELHCKLISIHAQFNPLPVIGKPFDLKSDQHGVAEPICYRCPFSHQYPFIPGPSFCPTFSQVISTHSTIFHLDTPTTCFRNSKTSRHQSSNIRQAKLDSESSSDHRSQQDSRRECHSSYRTEKYTRALEVHITGSRRKRP